MRGRRGEEERGTDRPTDRHLVGAEAAAKAGQRRGGAELVVVVEGDDDDVGQVVGVAVELELVQRVAYVALCDQAKKKERIKKEAKRCRAIKRKRTGLPKSELYPCADCLFPLVQGFESSRTLT